MAWEQLTKGQGCASEVGWEGWDRQGFRPGQLMKQLMNGEGYALEVGMEGLGGGCGQGQGGRGVGEMGCCFWATGLGAADDKKKMQRTHPQRTCQLWRLSAGALSVVAPFNPFAYLVQRPQVGMELQESTEWLLSKGLVRDTAPSTPPTPPPTLVWINGLLNPLEEVAAGVTDQELMYKIAMEQQRVQVCTGRCRCVTKGSLYHRDAGAEDSRGSGGGMSSATQLSFQLTACNTQ